MTKEQLIALLKDMSLEEKVNQMSQVIGGFFDDDTKNKWISACRKGTRQAITCGFLPPDSSGTLLYSNFLVMAFTYPKFMWSQMLPGENGDTARPIWGDFSLELREVRPHD